jgi:HK97 family phage major capsid protein
MPELNHEDLIRDVAQGVKALQEKSERQGAESDEVKEMAQKVSAAIIDINAAIASERASNAEHKARIEHLESIGNRSIRGATKSELKELCVAGLQMLGRDFAGVEEKEFGLAGEKIELKGFAGSDYTATEASRGGVFVTPTMITDMIYQNVRDSNPLLQEVRMVLTNTTAAVERAVKTGEGVGFWGGEMQDTQQAPKSRYRKISVPMHRVQVETAVTFELLSGSTFNFEQECLSDMTRDWGYGFVDGVTVGDGVNKAMGFTRGNYDAVSTIGAAARFDDLVLLPARIKEMYRKQGKFYMTQQVLANFLVEKSTGSGEYMQMFGLNGIDKVPTIAGREFVIIPTLATAPTTGQPVLYFGDMREAYTAARWKGSYIKRDALTAFSNGFVKLGIASFAGGLVVNDEALISLNVK